MLKTVKAVKRRQRRWFDRGSHTFWGQEHHHTHIRLIFWLSIVFNALLFVTVIAKNPPTWYTNDDFRMMTIVSGAYTGTPSPDIVFMRYPIGWLLSGLYSITTVVPWYGIFTMLCMYIPSCIFCYYIVKTAYEKHFTVLGVFLYMLLFVLFIQKYVCLPQFTLTSAFMGVGAIALIFKMPEERNATQIILAVFCAVISFAVRSKTFYLLLPVMIWIVAVRIFKEHRHYKKYVLWGASTLAVCLVVLGADVAAWSRPEYTAFKEFKEARSEVYDYGSIPGYYENMPFYQANGISEVTYRAISGRFLDLDKTVNTETLETIADYMDDIKTEANHIVQRMFSAFCNGLSHWYFSSDKTVKYCAIFMTVLFFVCITLSVKKRKPDVLLAGVVAGMLLEITFLEFNGRIMVRLVDLMLLTMAVVCCLSLTQILDKRIVSFDRLLSWMKSNKIRGGCAGLSFAAVCLFVLAGICNMQYDLDNRSLSLRETTNSKLEALMNYTKAYPDSFFFYDTYDFIACSSYVFTIYDEGTLLNNESTGSWNSHAPCYYQKNKKFGFTTAIEGLTSSRANVYFITSSAPKMGISKMLKDIYNKKLVEVDRIQATKDVLYVYMVTDDE